ncbi:hypothetical protein GQ43DRAFT_440756 [Delitschia confertaspora ATCC 74209]|uniref:Uncharacterized protein n=1 Tax=Delitschia confertaspora ATCC 74209 TaxID=1513339 RepID=A0A9P4JN60_9PLEO|nr:hypothetical protein GQ43DRAFT_440756 [Delitschia confertaspora ATCC 74209]
MSLQTSPQMSSNGPSSPGLPHSPRAYKTSHSPNPSISDTFTSSASSASSSPPPQYSAHQPRPQFPTRPLRNRDSEIFTNATIPLSPCSSITDSTHSDDLAKPTIAAPKRKQASGLARLFQCFGSRGGESEEKKEQAKKRRRRREEWYEVEVVRDGHWTEL